MVKSTLILLISTGLVAQCLCSRVVAEELVEPFVQVKVAPELKQEKLNKLLQRQFQLQFQGETLREFGYRLERQTGLFCWIDTQVNPEQILSLQTKFQSLNGILNDVCEQQQLKWIELGHGIFLTKQATAGMLLMLLDWQRAQMEFKVSGTKLLGTEEKFFWLKGRDVAWPLLSRPRDLVQGMASQGQFKITGMEKIPHDLLAPGMISDLSQMDYLQALLVQYGLTCRLKHKQELEIIPIEQLGLINLEYTIDLRKKEAYRDFISSHQGLKVNEQSKTWVVMGTPVILAEFHGFHLSQTTSNKTVVKAPTKLSLRKFTLKVENGKVLEIMQFLKNNDVAIYWDEKLADAPGVNLNIRLSLDLKDANLEEMLGQLLPPAGLTFHIENEAVKVIPDTTRPPTN